MSTARRTNEERGPGILLVVVLSLAFVVRIVAMTQHPDTYPDAFFQYLEPAWWKVQGYGYPTWEWAVGFRSWIPAAYYGVWMELWRLVGVTDAGFLALFFGVQGCALGTLLVLGLFRLGNGLLDQRAGFVAAAIAAASPVLAYYSPQTIIEPPAMVPGILGLALVYGKPLGKAEGTLADRDRHWVLAGALLGLCGMLRLPFAVLGAFVALDLLVTRRFVPLAKVTAAALVPIALFGAVDWLTWGKPFHSTLQFIEYHSKGRGREHGAVELLDFYPKLFWDRAAPLLVVVALAALVSVRRTWRASVRLMVLIALAVVPQMFQPQKLERFVLLFWPLFYVLSGVALSGAVALLVRARSTKGDRAFAGAVVLLLGASGVFGVRSLKAGPKYDYSELWGLFDGQTEVGRQRDATGLLFESRPHLTGGYFRLGKNVPFAPFSTKLADNPLFNYVILKTGSGNEGALKARHFTHTSTHGDYGVWHRQTPAAGTR